MVKLCVEAFRAKDDTSAQAFVSQAKFLVKSLNKLEMELQKSNACDLELGKLSTSHHKLNIHGANGREEVKEHEVVLSSSAFAFCLRGLVRETREIEKGIKELVQWENPSSQVNLYETSCKIDALCNI
ncbi:hypothetical protein L1987_13567 [Smallanthus sonchifolius]|uniref:Uncharacterized protein n=1 Tax=Smallanthus sonchifolius TaxID=185202 RepID=A0ACB9JHB1_9ASTR|nr:hypothetical protein L1987_13567 [Smallanthus sonchifolius]